jgi:hypothetical protein
MGGVAVGFVTIARPLGMSGHELLAVTVIAALLS